MRCFFFLFLHSSSLIWMQPKKLAARYIVLSVNGNEWTFAFVGLICCRWFRFYSHFLCVLWMGIWPNFRSNRIEEQKKIMKENATKKTKTQSIRMQIRKTPLDMRNQCKCKSNSKLRTMEIDREREGETQKVKRKEKLFRMMIDVDINKMTAKNRNSLRLWL